MRNLILGSLIVSILLTIASCALLGIHFDVHNPKKEGKLPKFSQEDILLGEMTKLRSCYDVHYYDFLLEVFPDDKKLKGKVEIHSTATIDFEQLQIDLHPNFEILSLKDKSTDQDLKYSREERAVFVSYSKKEKDQFVIEIEYEGKPPVAKKAPWKGGFVWEKDKNGKPWLGVACEGDGASLWWALKDHTADEPDSIRMHYTVPNDVMAVGNGQFEGKQKNENTTTYNWFVSYPINAYNVTIYVGDFQEIKETYVGLYEKDLAITHFVLKENYKTAKKHFKQLLDILEAFEDLFGEYPWYRDGFKLVESPYKGMEHQTAIAYGNGYENDLDEDTDYIILHETAHEWWGNSVTAKDLGDVWLQEGFATYAEALYVEYKDGKSEYDYEMSFKSIFIKNKYPVVSVKDRRWFHAKKCSDVYTKGAWILHSLRSQINDDELFFDIIKSFATKYKYKLVESKDFIDLVNEKTNKDYNWFFDHYLYEHQAPELAWDYMYEDENNAYFYYKWNNTSSNFNLLEIVIETTTEQEFYIKPTNEAQRIKLKSDLNMDIYLNTPSALIAFKRDTNLEFDHVFNTSN
jgi:aminopeptidase N